MVLRTVRRGRSVLAALVAPPPACGICGTALRPQHRPAHFAEVQSRLPTLCEALSAATHVCSPANGFDRDGGRIPGGGGDDVLGMDQRDVASRFTFAARASSPCRAVVAAACVGALTLPAAGVVAARTVGGDPAVAQRPAQVDDFACTGPPPFAGQVPDGETKAEQAVNRQVEALAFAIWRAANCPLDETQSSSVTDGTVVPDLPCSPGRRPTRPIPRLALSLRRVPMKRQRMPTNVRGARTRRRQRCWLRARRRGFPRAFRRDRPTAFPLAHLPAPRSAHPTVSPPAHPMAFREDHLSARRSAHPRAFRQDRPLARRSAHPMGVPAGPPVSTPTVPPTAPPAERPVGPPAGLPGAPGGAGDG